MPGATPRVKQDVPFPSSRQCIYCPFAYGQTRMNIVGGLNTSASCRNYVQTTLGTNTSSYSAALIYRVGLQQNGDQTPLNLVTGRSGMAL